MNFALFVFKVFKFEVAQRSLMLLYIFVLIAILLSEISMLIKIDTNFKKKKKVIKICRFLV